MNDSLNNQEEHNEGLSEIAGVDMRQIDILRSLGEDLSKELFQTFIERKFQIINDLDHAAENNSHEEIRRLTHSIRNTSLQLGFNRIGRIARTMEHLAECEMLDEMKKLNARLAGELERVRCFLEQSDLI